MRTQWRACFPNSERPGGPVDTIANDAAQLVVNVDDAFQLVGGLGEDPAARTCSLRKEGGERRDVTIAGDATQLVENAPRDARPQKIGMSLLCYTQFL